MVHYAEVKTIDFSDKDPMAMRSIGIRLLSDVNTTKDSELTPAVPYDLCSKYIPVVGEIVEIIDAPSNSSTSLSPLHKYYYRGPVPLQSLINHNILSTASDVIHATPTSGNSKNIQEAQTGNPVTKDKPAESISHIENDKISPLQHYEGDYLIEGRYGHSIRFSSTIDKNVDQYPVKPQWQKGKGKNGDPILILRNGQKPASKTINPTEVNKFITEDINTDSGAIYFTSTQEIPLLRASEQVKSLEHEKLFPKKKFDGEQVIIASDRIVLNSRKKETLIFSGGGIGLSSGKSITVDTGNIFSVAGKEIHLGTDAKTKGEPAVLGNTMEILMVKVMDLLNNLVQDLISHTHPTGVGPSSPPIPAYLPTALTTIAKIKQNIKAIKSDYVFLADKSDYTKETPVAPPPSTR